MLSPTKRVYEEVAKTRQMILDICEQELGTSAKWGFIRNRLLKALGESGLEGNLKRILRNGEEKCNNQNKSTN